MTIGGLFVESKEALSGLYLVEAPHQDAALAIAAECPGGWLGAIVVRPGGDRTGGDRIDSDGSWRSRTILFGCTL